MKRHRWWLVECLAAIGFLAASVDAAEPIEGRIDYAREIKPLLKARCYACHGVLKQEAGLRLDAGRTIRLGGENGAVLAPGKTDGRLVERISSPDKSVRMPPEGEPLSSVQIARIKAWIEQGANSPDDEQPELDPRRHWAFQTPVRIDAPQVVNGEWVRNPIDAFVAQEHARHKLAAQPPAPKQVLLRRVYLDLIGLPPTREELQAFLADESPEAYAKVVDRLLDSAQHGERWGRHWMDIWRYSDWFGRRYVPDVWNSAPQIWRWRDWIVKSLNDDKGYDQMVREMLAADEIAPEDDEAGHATGYLIRNWYALNPNDWMRSNVEHTGKAFLGLTFNCAHCHDHKYDPISQDDYFRLRAFFEPISIRQERVPGEADPGPFQEYNYSTLRKIVRLGAVRIFDKTPDAPTWFYTGGDERNRVTERGSMPPGVPAFLMTSPLKIEPVKLPPRAWYPGLRPAIRETILAQDRAAIAASESQLPAARAAAAAALPELKTKLAQAEADFAQARLAAEQAGRAGALVGRQSLLLDATAGRRVVQQGMQNVKSLDDGAILRFQLQIVKDAHVNFQLAKDVVKGLTAGYVAFEKGRILSYQPASFTEFEVGRYDFATGQNRFEVSLVLQTKEDRGLLTVRSLSDQKLLVESVPVARNGWSPIGDVTKAISFDARTGSVAAFDEVTLTAPVSADAGTTVSPTRLAYFDFEPPLYIDGRDVSGIDGWLGSSFSQAPATSVVSSTIGDESLKPLSQKGNTARRAVDVYELKVKSLEAKHAASIAELASTEARIAADRTRHGETTSADADGLARTASQLQRAAGLRKAEADVLTADQLLAAAESKPADDANRAKEIDAAGKQLAAARTAWETARAALADPAQATTYAPFSPTYPQTSTGRRQALAKWITSRDNPLTARVAVNHIWLRHFHSPLVASVYDFGLNGSPPTHPALLDWLAVELMESNWSMKHLHRVIVTSNAYRMSSSSGPGAGMSRDIDPENKFLWRMNVGRMEAEVVRDSLLHSAGRLDMQLGGQELENSQALTTRRRTLYYSCQPELDGKSPFGALFDAPEPTDCYRRTRSVIPQQALALTNSDLIHELSGALAAELWRSLPPEQQAAPQPFVTAAHEQILSRSPTAAELSACVAFLSTPGEAGTDPVRLRESLVRAILNHNDFVAIR
ncbi:MAG: DUF1553 domain-containing protein [Planctomycetota bacterium]